MTKEIAKQEEAIPTETEDLNFIRKTCSNPDIYDGEEILLSEYNKLTRQKELT